MKKMIDLGRNAEGKRIRKRVYGKTETELNRNIAKLLNESAEHPSDITFAKYADRWINTYKTNREKNTVAMYKNILKKTGLIDGMAIRLITKTDLQMVINENKEHPRICQQMEVTFKQIWNTALEDGIVTKNVATTLDLPKYLPKLQRVLTDKEKKAIKGANFSPMERLYISVLYYFGLRPGEAVGLMRSDFDLKQGVLTVRRAVAFDKNDPYIKTTKTDNVRTLPIPSEFAPILRDYSEGASLYLFNYNGHIMSKTSVRNLWYRCRDEINRKLGGNENLDLTNGLRPYTFRHSYCTTCYYSGITIKKCQSLMGHSSAQMIMKVYAHLDDKKESIENLKSLII